MKPGHTASRTNISRCKHGKPGKVGTAHNKDMGAQELADQQTRRMGAFSGSKVKNPNRAEKDFLKRKGNTQEAQALVNKVRASNLAKNIDTSKFK